MKIFRVEHRYSLLKIRSKKLKQGPYVYQYDDNGFNQNYFTPYNHIRDPNFDFNRCPNPADDKIRESIVWDQKYYYGFESIEQALNWFAGCFDHLHMAGFYLAVYDYAEDTTVLKGRKQILFLEKYITEQIGMFFFDEIQNISCTELKKELEYI